MKTVDTSALSPLRMLVTDICRERPELIVPLSNDIASLERVVVTRGLRVLLEDLPALGKAFDKGLSSGWFSEPSGLGTLRNKTLRFYCLISECFTTHGTLIEPCEPNTVLYIRQLCYMYKKLQVPCPAENVTKTVKEFVKLDESLRPPSAFWDDPKLIPLGAPASKLCLTDAEDSFFGSSIGLEHSLLKVTQKVADIIVSMIPEPDWRDLIPRHGPGAVSDLKTGAYKYTFPTWSAKLSTMFPQEYFTSPWGDLSGSDLISEDKVVPGRLLAVPKTYTKPRLITSEPTANQYCQQAILKYLRENFPQVLRRSVNFFSQSPSRDGAKEASITGDMATVDLSSASDLLSCWTVERVFRRNPALLSLLAASRTSYVTDATGSNVFKYLRLRKFAGQGSAVTFPIQTMVYTIIAISAVIADHYGPSKAATSRISKRALITAAGKVRVFGDDIIIPGGFTLWYLERIMQSLQLKVNMAKTHHHGLFRESCGMDAYAGYEVTPVYLASLTPGRKAESILSWIDVSNSFHRNGYWNLSTWMADQLKPSMAKLVPVSRQSEDYALSLHTFSHGCYFPGKVRFSKDLHRYEGRALVLSSRDKREQGGTTMNLLQYFIEGAHSQDTFLGPTLARWEHGHISGKSLVLKRDWVHLR